MTVEGRMAPRAGGSPEANQRIVRAETIAFDVDGVVADTFRVFVDTAQRDFGYGFSYEDITEYDFRNVIDIDEEDSLAIVQRILEDPIGCGIAPISGAVPVLTRLSREAPLLFVTARPDGKAIRDWILHHLPDVAEDRIRVEATGAGDQKQSVLLDHGVTHFVEDCLETGFLLEPLPITPIIFDQPWNRKPHPFPVVRTWHQIAEMLFMEGKAPPEELNPAVHS
jgi:uncharacterized HAD superfamily protein